MVAATILDTNGKPIKRKQAVLETRYSIEKKPKKYGDDSEDESQPSNMKAKTNAKAGPSEVGDEGGDSDDPPAAKPPPKKVPVEKEEPDSETEVAPQARKRQP